MHKKLGENLWEVCIERDFTFCKKYEFRIGDTIIITDVVKNVNSISGKAFVVGICDRYPELVGKQFSTSLVKDGHKIITLVETTRVDRNQKIHVLGETIDLIKKQLIKVKKRKLLLLTTNKF